jgi:phosphoglycolate phosphatase
VIKYVVFDFDGTLVDSKDVAISAINQLAEKHKFKKILEKDIQYLRSLSIPERCNYLGLPMYKIPFLAVDFYSLYRHAMKNVVLFDGIKELLNELNNKGYHLAIISSNSEKNIKEFLENNQINTIEEVLCSDNLFGKDRIIKKFLKTNKLETAEVIYIGDELRDIIACKKSDIKVIWVGWGYDIIENARQESPDHMVNSPNEILKIV